MGDRGETGTEEWESGAEVGIGDSIDLQPALHDDPASIERGDFARRVGIHRPIEHEHRHSRSSSGGEVEEVLTGQKENRVLARNLTAGECHELLELGKPLAAHVETPQSGQR
jgi:hypothetical protein